MQTRANELCVLCLCRSVGLPTTMELSVFKKVIEGEKEGTVGENPFVSFLYHYFQFTLDQIALVLGTHFCS